MKRELVSACRAGLLSLAIASQVQAAPYVLTADELEQERGGFLVAGDVAFEFGAVMRTFENGELALQTQVNWTGAGAVVNHTPGTGVALGSQHLAGATAFTSAGGSTHVHSVTPRQVANMVLNTASNRDFRQETDLTLVLPGFDATQGDITRELAGLRIADDIAGGAIRALGR